VMEIGNLSRAVSYLGEDERCLIANEALRIPAVLDSELGVVSESRLFPPQYVGMFILGIIPTIPD
jgi:hypothetical protein